MPDLFLHIGTNKTATTLIQDFALQNPELLHQHRCFYPAVGLSGPAHHQFADHLLDRELDPRFRAKCSFDELLKRMHRDVNGNTRVILSSEALWWARRVRQYRLNELFGGFNKQTIIIYIRRQDSHAASMYNSQIKFGLRRDASSFQEFCKQISLDHYSNLRRWEEIAPAATLVVRPFVPQAWRGGNVLRDFFGHIDPQIEIPAPAKLRRENASAPIASTVILRELNPLDPRRREDLRRIVEEVAAEWPEPEDEGFLTHEMQRSLLQEYEESNRLTCQRYWSNEEARAYMEQHVPSFSNEYRGPTHAQYAALIAALWARH